MEEGERSVLVPPDIQSPQQDEHPTTSCDTSQPAGSGPLLFCPEEHSLARHLWSRRASDIRLEYRKEAQGRLHGRSEFTAEAAARLYDRSVSWLKRHEIRYIVLGCHLFFKC